MGREEMTERKVTIDGVEIPFEKLESLGWTPQPSEGVPDNFAVAAGLTKGKCGTPGCLNRWNE